jgi:transcriptional regulator with PAS, ATPase and Fis domain
VGSNLPKPIDIRLICATNLPVEELMSEKRLRQDLLYRINTVEIRLPPLRERKEDIPLLVDHFLRVYCRKYNRPLKKVSPPALNALENHSWPGNVRELQHALERVVILSESDTLLPGDFSFSPLGAKENIPALNTCDLEEAEKMLIIKAVSKHGGNLTKAAKELGITRASLYRRLEKYGL